MKNILIGLTCIILLTMAIGCGDSGNSEDFWWDSNFYIYNETIHDLDIWVDGLFYFTLTPGTTNTIETVPPGIHLLEAYISQTGPLYEWREIDNSFDEDYNWYIY